MSYTIDIIDTVNNDLVLTIEKAMRRSIVLSWQGADAKDDLQVVGSSLKFTLFDETAQDGYYDALFTGDETRYLVTVIHDATQQYIWQGHLLPDSYSEPYERALVDVSLEAVCGIGRLKGKYLPDDFYQEEKSVIQILSACFFQTGLQLPMYFAPAIENAVLKNYNQIYIDTVHFVDNSKKQDAYTILSTLMLDMVCCAYQCDNRWYVTPLNKRQMQQMDYKHYDYNGNYIGVVPFTRLLKPAKALGRPLITMVPPYGEITVTHEREKIELPETIFKEENDGWAITTGVIGQILASDWNGNNNYYADTVAPDYKVRLSTVLGNDFTDLDLTKFIDLKTKIYVAPGDKFSFTLKLSPDRSAIYAPSTGAYFQNGGRVQVKLDDVILQEYDVEFTTGENELTATIQGDFVMQAHGLLDIIIYQPFSDSNLSEPRIRYYFLDDLKLELVGFNDQHVVSDFINQDYTNVKDLELTFSDDYYGFSKAFLLARLREQNQDYNTILVPVLYGSVFQDQNYAVVSLMHANLIADNLNSVYHNGQLLQDIDVVYNYNTGEEMVVLLPFSVTAGNLEVRVYKINDISGDRSYWQQWTDAVYQIETKRYAQCVANVYRRMFNVPHYKIDMVVDQSVKFNDLITFPYKEVQNYLLTSCTWDMDSNETTITSIKGYYLNDVVENPTDNIPPIVDAGPDIYLSQTDTSVTFDATAYDPDGFIVSYQWEKVSGPSGDTITSANTEDTFVSGLSGDLYEYKLTVTDNNGATASDTVKVIRIQQYTFNPIITCTTDLVQGQGQGSYLVRRRVFGLTVSPNIDPGTVLQVVFKFSYFQIQENSNTDNTDYLNNDCQSLNNSSQILDHAIQKNGVLIYGNGTGTGLLGIVPVNMVAGDEIFVQIEAMTPSNNNTRCEILEVIDVNGNSEILGLPLIVEAYDQYIEI